MSLGRNEQRGLVEEAHVRGRRRRVVVEVRRDRERAARGHALGIWRCRSSTPTIKIAAVGQNPNLSANQNAPLRSFHLAVAKDVGRHDEKMAATYLMCRIVRGDVGSKWRRATTT